ncbi:MAG: hypothetical protein WDN04_00395 [Rhodospirillales bacterium]
MLGARAAGTSTARSGARGDFDVADGFAALGALAGDGEGKRPFRAAW